MEAHSLVGDLYRGHRRHAAGHGRLDGARATGHGMDCLADRHAGVHCHGVDDTALAGDHYSDDDGGGVDLLRNAGC
ncbi:hypothetical protein D3C72_1828290 [compost metagenome]